MAVSGNSRRRRSNNQHVTKNGNVFHIHRNLTERWIARRDATERRKAERKAGLPKSRLKRFIYHFNPKRMYHYWFSRDGGVMALKIVGIGLVVGFITLLGVFAYFRKDLPKLNDVYGTNIGGSIRYYDRTGETLLWEDYDAVKRIPVKTEEMSKFMRDATVSIEDKDFFKHGGFDVRGIMRAGFNDVFGSGGTQGGSTITQQLVKLSQDWTNDRTLIRKVKEVILAVELERSYSKEDILTGYLNAAPYGNIQYGVEAATRDYFQKSASKLTLDEAAFLAAIPKSPSIYSPYGAYYDKAELLGRQGYILDQMVNEGYITRDEADKAKKVDILKKVKKQQPKYAGIKSPYFVLAAKKQLDERFIDTTKRGGWKVITTMDKKLQGIAEKVVKDNIPNALAKGADSQAIVAQDVKTGQMVALVGGTDFSNNEYGKINYAQWNISPGSSYKPYDYAALIENGTNVGSGSVLYDKQGAIPGYACTVKGLPPPKGNSNCLQNYDFRYPGPLTLRYALGGSRNVPAVKAMLIAGTDKVIEMSDKMMYQVKFNNGQSQTVEKSYKCYNPGVDVNTATVADEAQCYGSSAIGDGAYLRLDHHVNGLATMARMGKAYPATYILSITDAANKNVYKWEQPKGEQVIREDTAYIVNDMASDPNASYLPFGYYKWHNYNGWKTGIKTGTTNNGFDGLMMAWNTQYAVGSWVGYHTRNKALSGSMEQMTAPLARGFMTAALDLKKTPENWKKPAGVKTEAAFVVRSHVGIGSVEPSPSKDLYPSWFTGNKKQASANKPIDIVSNKLATDCTPNLARKSATNSNANVFSVDIFVDAAGANGDTTKTDDVHKCDDVRPSVDSISFSSPGGSSCDSPCTITASINAGTHSLYNSKYAGISGSGTVNLVIDGKTVQTKRAESNVSFTYTGTGSKSVSVQVIDSVLYDASRSAGTISFESTTSSIEITSPNNGDDVGPSENISWSGGTATFTVTRKKSGGSEVTVCTTASFSCTVSFPTTGNYTIKVTDGSSDSDSINVSR